jgi:hypothetical protein
MDAEAIRQHIQAVAERDEAASLSLAGRFHRACWPGAGADRTDPSARGWLRRWRPARAAATTPVCSCAAGRCAVCN